MPFCTTLFFITHGRLPCGLLAHYLCDTGLSGSEHFSCYKDGQNNIGSIEQMNKWN